MRSFRQLGCVVGAICMLGLLGSCGDDKDDKIDLDGTWRSTCYEDPEDEDFSTQTYSFSGGTATYVGVDYGSDSTCETEVFSITVVANHTLHGETFDQNHAIDFALTSVLIAGLHQSVVDSWNESAFCDKTDWEVGVGVESDTCGVFPLVKGITIYDLVNVAEDNTSLRVGDSDGDNDGYSAETRPTTIDPQSFSKD